MSGRIGNRRGRNFAARIAALGCLMFGIAAPAPAQEQYRRILGGFLSTGGYFFTSGSADTALGSPKFYSETRFYARPVERGGWQISGGIDLINASDHFLPFSGGNTFSLIGPGFRATTPRVLGRLRPYVGGGLYAGRARSERLGFDSTDFTPSLNFGVEWPFARYFTLGLSYRLSERIRGVNTDGFALTLRVF